MPSEAARPLPRDEACSIILQPLSHPDLEPIRIEDNLFAIGRSEAPFVTYDAAVVADLSRRHARIFSEFGAVYIADLGSKNGTTVNGVAVRQKPCRLKDGDEIGLGGTLAFKVRLAPRAAKAGPATRLLSLTLSPEQGDRELQPIVITRFPFLVSKTDPGFARYKEKYPHQINYISRRHAHIFLKGGQPFVEDLGSTNGTFLDGQRLDEHAVALHEGNRLAFGGHQLSYRVSLQSEAVSEPTATRLSLVPPTAGAAGDSDRTTFLAAADSFLDIFCIDPAADDAETNAEPPPPAAAASNPPAGKRSRLAVFLGELREAFAGDQPRRARTGLRWGGLLVAGLAGLALVLYLGASDERELKGLVADGRYAEAAQLARQSLARHPDHPEIRALGSEALLKASLPDWLAKLKARDFAGAAAAIAGMQELAVDNPDVQPLIGELEWLGRLEQFIASRGSAEAPIRIYADEATIGAFLKEWNDNSARQQRAFSAIAAQVPEFRETYAHALSHLRKLQSDDAVYLAAIDRLKAMIAAELQRDRPQAIAAVLDEYAEKYPRLAGLDRLRRDLEQYLALDEAAAAGRLAPLAAGLAELRLATPPFQEKLRALGAAGRLPSAEVLARYQGIAAAWQKGDAAHAIAGLQQLADGPWAEAAAAEIRDKKAVVAQFAELQAARGSKGYDDRLLAFYGTLDPREDRYFIEATAADLARLRGPALKRAQELLDRAQARWRQYRDNGPIEAAQRQEASVSTEFRAQARLLGEAQSAAEQASRLHAQLKEELPAAGQALQAEIAAEAEAQRRALLDLRATLEPALWKAKLALIGDRHGEQ